MVINCQALVRRRSAHNHVIIARDKMLSEIIKTNNKTWNGNVFLFFDWWNDYCWYAQTIVQNKNKNNDNGNYKLVIFK